MITRSFGEVNVPAGLFRVGGKYSDNWHFNHMWDPQSTSSGSIMPSYKWLILSKHDRSATESKMEAMVSLGVPYTEEDIAGAQQSMKAQARAIEQNLYNDPDFVKSYEEDKKFAEERGETFVEMQDREIVALIAYLQRLGTDIKIKDPVSPLKTNRHVKIHQRSPGHYRWCSDISHHIAVHFLSVLPRFVLVGVHSKESVYRIRKTDSFRI